jgi:hypothetical protein
MTALCDNCLLLLPLVSTLCVCFFFGWGVCAELQRAGAMAWAAIIAVRYLCLIRGSDGINTDGGSLTVVQCSRGHFPELSDYTMFLLQSESKILICNSDWIQMYTMPITL